MSVEPSLEKSLWLNGKPYSYQSIRNGPYDKSALNDFERSFLSFSHDWLNGKEAFVQQTSGSTGKPKSIHISRQQMKISAGLTVKSLDLKAGDTALVCINTDYIGGKMMLVRAFEHKLDIVGTDPSSNPLNSLKLGKTLDFAALVPYQLHAILVEENKEQLQALNKMKAIILGGGAVSLQLEKQVKTLIVPVYSTYGMTETVSHIALKRLNGASKSKYFKVFKDVKLGLDSRGCLTINAALTNHKTLVTNDMVSLHGTSEFEWLGRIDNVINSGGVKIHPEVIEAHISSIFFDMDTNNRFFVAGMPDDKLGSKVVLMIESKPWPTVLVEQLKGRLSKELSQYQAPREVYFMKKFKETPTGKINREEMVGEVVKG